MTQIPTIFKRLSTALLVLAFLVSSSNNEAAGQEAPPREIAITVDDLPVNYMRELGVEGSEKITLELLKGLKEHDVPAIGFVNMGKLFQEDGSLDNRRLGTARKLARGRIRTGQPHLFAPGPA